MARINQAAMSRQEQRQDDRVPFFLYIDEFHNFITPSIASILSGARKYGLGLVLAHQDTRQLKSRSEDVASSVLANAYTRVVFRVSEQDARSLADGFAFFETDDLQNLGVGEAIARVEQAAFDFNLRTAPLPKIDQTLSEYRRSMAQEWSRAQYATPREEIEAVLRAESEAMAAAEETKRAAKEAAKRKDIAPKPGPAKAEETKPETATDKPPVKLDPKFTAPLASVERMERPKRPMPDQPGRGGPQHKYLQSLIKRAAEDRGFRASTERTVLGGHGHVDVALEREGMSIACEISISTDAEHELGNLAKCLAAGFDYSILVSSDKKTLSSVEAAFLAELPQEQHARVRFLTPERLLSFLDESLAASRSSTETVRGYKVTTKYKTKEAEERERRERIIGEVISKSLRRKKK